MTMCKTPEIGESEKTLKRSHLETMIGNSIHSPPITREEKTRHLTTKLRAEMVEPGHHQSPTAKPETLASNKEITKNQALRIAKTTNRRPHEIKTLRGKKATPKEEAVTKRT